MREVHDEGEFIFALSHLNEEIAPGNSAEHSLEFTVLLNIECKLRFSAQCVSKGIGTYDSNDGPTDAWQAEIDIGGRKKKTAVVGKVANYLTVNDGLASRDTSDAQHVRVSADLMAGGGSWEKDVSLEHPFTIIWT